MKILSAIKSRLPTFILGILAGAILAFSWCDGALDALTARLNVIQKQVDTDCGIVPEKESQD